MVWRARVLARMHAVLRDERGSMLSNVLKVAIVLLVVLAAALLLSSLGDERASSRLMATAAGSDASAPVGVRAIPWMD